MVSKRQIFISYKRDVEPDDRIAREVAQSLSRYHNVFIDQSMIIGEKWVKRIDQELNKADYIIVFLSAESIKSEFVQLEVEKAHERQILKGKPILLPVRLNFVGKLGEPLANKLDPINWAHWKNDADTPRLLEQLLQAIQQGEITPGETHVPLETKVTNEVKRDTLPEPVPAASLLPLENPEGALSANARMYMKRQVDDLACDEIAGSQVTLVIKGPRQIGKSSLLNYVLATGMQSGKRAVVINFQQMDGRSLEDPNIFYRQFCAQVGTKLRLPIAQIEAYWNENSANLGNKTTAGNYFQEYILKPLDASLILALDETDRMFNSYFASDFFGMLRSWHEARSQNEPLWQKLNLVLIASTEPKMFIPNPYESPFNVGTVLQIPDFTPSEVAELNTRHNHPFDETRLEKLYDLLQGHPYLVRKSMYVTAKHYYTPDELFERAIDSHGNPFWDHLKRYYFLVHTDKGLMNGLRQVLQKGAATTKKSLIAWNLPV